MLQAGLEFGELFAVQLQVQLFLALGFQLEQGFFVLEVRVKFRFLRFQLRLLGL